MALIVIIKHLKPNDIMDIVRDLRHRGINFDFAYTPEKMELWGSNNYFRFTTFTFYDEKYATWFALRYANYL